MAALATGDRDGLQIRFLGGAGTVTGSMFLVEGGGARVLIDCGLYQGVKQLRLRNWEQLPLDPASLDAVVLSHAHVDHSGRLPLLGRAGFRGPIHATAPTIDLASILLPDAARIQEEDAAFANRHGFSRHRPALPLYTEADAHAVLQQMQPLALHRDLFLGDLRIRLRGAGHILGAASVEVATATASVCFSGDLGRSDDPICPPPEPPPAVARLIMESTYGDRLHPLEDPAEMLARLLELVFTTGGILLVPAFAVGRTQALAYWIDRIFTSLRVPRMPVIVDSPMACDVTSLYHRHSRWHRLSSADCDRIFGGLRLVRTVEQSKAVGSLEGPAVLISASGMLTGGRVLHHFRRLAPDPRNVILLAGYQAPGTRGASLLAGIGEIKMHGGYVPVRARVEHLDVFSAHADHNGLMAWLAAAERPPEAVTLVHGEPVAADGLRRGIEERLHLACDVAEYDGTLHIGGPGA